MNTLYPPTMNFVFSWIRIILLVFSAKHLRNCHSRLRSQSIFNAASPYLKNTVKSVCNRLSRHAPRKFYRYGKSYFYRTGQRKYWQGSGNIISYRGKSVNIPIKNLLLSIENVLVSRKTLHQNIAIFIQISNSGGTSISSETYFPFFFRCRTHSERRYSICPFTDRKSSSAQAAIAAYSFGDRRSGTCFF